MAEVHSLSKVRKSKTRIAKRQKADENAVKFGRSKAEKARDAAKAAREARHLDAHKRDDADG